MITAACIVAASIIIAGVLIAWCMCRSARHADDQRDVLVRQRRSELISQQMAELEVTMQQVREMLDALR